MTSDLLTALLVGFGFAISGFFSSLGQAVNKIYFEPWLKKFKRRHDKIIREIKK